MTLTPHQEKVIADLKIQAMIFDMDVDLEAASIVPRRVDNRPVWQKRWIEKNQSADRQPEDYEGGPDGRF